VTDTVGRRPRVLIFSRSAPGGIMARRASELAARAPTLEVAIAPRTVGRRALARRIRAVLTAEAPDAVVVFDSNPRELAPAALLRARRVPLLLDTGDVGAALLAKAGTHGRARRAGRTLVERASWHRADTLMVRGEGFRGVLARHGVARAVEVLPDGVDLKRFRPLDPRPWRARLGLADTDLAIGTVGSITWSPSESTAYGWELVEALPLTPSGVKAVIVGEGDGLARLRARSRALGVEDRLRTTGQIPHRAVPGVLAALDAVTWTQTPDDVGVCRTTMKLPEYLACGKFILASDVGEARRSVAGNGRRLRYRGGRDPEFVQAVARVALELCDDRTITARGIAGRAAAAAHFDWDRLGRQFAAIVEETIRRAGSG
jgi:glycosyltransferase involved in cell wall biosynthesis